jgi:protein SCO1/2
VCLVVVVVIAVAGTACARRPVFQGQVLDPARPALDFNLPDQAGHAVTLSALRGKVVALTFLYTTCPDVCPLVTAKIREVTELLGKRRQGVAFLAITVDPGRDTTAAVAQYSQRWNMSDRWQFLTGSEQELRPIWSYYWVGQLGPPEKVRRSPGAAYAVGHGSPVHLFDKRGQIRIVFDADFRPAAMAHDLETLLGE